MNTEEGQRSHRDPTRMLTTRTDPLAVAATIGSVPVISAEQYAHVGRFAGAFVMTVFEQIGGVPRMASWADQNPTDFYTKLFPKMIQRSTAVEHTGTLTIDDAITRLERMEDADYDEVDEVAQFSDAPQYDL